MDKRMSKDVEDALQKRVRIVYNMYVQAIRCGKLVPCIMGVTHTFKSLKWRDYKLKDTFWSTTAIFYAGSLIAIIAENGVIYSFVNMQWFSPETKCIIKGHLEDLLKELNMRTQPHLIYHEKIDEWLFHSIVHHSHYVKTFTDSPNICNCEHSVNTGKTACNPVPGMVE